VGRNISVGLLGTVAVHLFFLVFFLAIRLHNVRVDHKDTIEVELKQDDVKPPENIERKILNQEMEEFSKNMTSNAISNLAAEKLQEDISTSRYEQEIKNEIGYKDPEPQPEQKEQESIEEIKKPDAPKKIIKEDLNRGPTRVSYRLEPNRNYIRIPRPNYLCEGGGTIVIGIFVDQLGNVIEANIVSSTTEEECIKEYAISSARNALFETDMKAPKKVNGIITYVFVPQ
jgi:hypothetical protein